MDRGQFVEWRYEDSESQSTSKIVARGLFLLTIQQLRPHVISDLFKRAFPAFLALTAERFGVLSPSTDEETHRMFAAFRRIPECEFKEAAKDWHSLTKAPDTKTLRNKLHDWAKESNLSDDWCLDHAVTCMRVAALHAYGAEHSWIRAIHGLKSNKFWDRTILKAEVYGDPLFSDRNGHAVDSMGLFRFSWGPKKRGKHTLEIEHAGWDFFDIERTEYRQLVEKEFNKKIGSRRIREAGLLRGASTAFQKELQRYFENAERMKRQLVSKYKLLEVSKNYHKEHTADSHIEWLVRYQVPPVERYADIKSVDITSDAIRKQVGKMAQFIGLNLRNPGVHTGRPQGSKTKSTTQLVAPRSKPVSPKVRNFPS